MPSAPYYRHEDPSGSALNNLASEPAKYDELVNKPRVFTYKPSYGASSHGHQGITQPAPVYYASQPPPQPPMGYYPPQPPSRPYYYSNPPPPPYPPPYSPAPAPHYYYPHQAAYAAPPDTPMGYYYSQPPSFYQANPPVPYHTPAVPYAAPGYQYPPQVVGSGAHYPGYPYPAQAQPQSGNTILPDGTTLFVGKTREQVMWENQQIATNIGANEPVQMVPYKASPGQQFWCRELDGSWTLRTVQETMLDLQPGYWDKGQSGHAVFIRQKP